jgi:hypothetical protein
MSHGDEHLPVSGAKIAGFWYTKVKLLLLVFYMALYMPFHLRQRISRIYQDHPAFLQES